MTTTLVVGRIYVSVPWFMGAMSRVSAGGMGRPLVLRAGGEFTSDALCGRGNRARRSLLRVACERLYIISEALGADVSHGACARDGKAATAGFRTPTLGCFIFHM